jgi:hypothetical protein
MSHTPSANLGLARHVVVWVFLVTVAFTGFFLTGTRREQKTVLQIPESVSVLKQTTGIAAATAQDNSNNNKNNEIVQGLSGDVPYYHCPGIRTGSTTTSTSSGSSSNHKDIVLLHGSKFTKEDWKTSGILEKLCQSGDASSYSLSVTALDLHVLSNHEVLQQTLIGLAANNLVTLPVSAIVTPSASGFAMVDWLQQADQQLGGVIADIQRNNVQAWIPIASPSISLPTDAQLSALASHTPTPYPILAIYGSRDGPGQQVSQRLHRLAGAVVIELEGGHPCYLDSPDAFVETVRNYVRQIP